VAIVSAYNDLLSAHQPFERYPAQLKRAVGKAGGVPAMCDGITQGRSGMDLSLFSREVVAMATAVALSHDMFDSALLLGVCDKLVPGLLIGALSFGQLPTVLVPAGPMPSGLPNGEMSKIRQLHAEGEIGRDELLDAEAGDYHAPGTCTFFGTANSNQLVVEAMGPVTAPARVFDDQADFLAAFERGELDRDHVAVVRHQGPRANGMPELHKLTPALGVLVDRGHQVALVTDRRMSGASGKVPAAIQSTPAPATGGPLSRVADGDVVRLDATAGTLDVVGADLAARPPAPAPPAAPAIADGTGRDLFAPFRERVGRPDAGASVFGDAGAAPPHPFTPRLAGRDTLAA
jgi:dihydroxyacid dehydratase/phosphogluconate dehydratase